MTEQRMRPCDGNWAHVETILEGMVVTKVARTHGTP